MLLYDVINTVGKLRFRYSERANSLSSRETIASNVKLTYGNPIGLSEDLFKKFLNRQISSLSKDDVMESTHHREDTVHRSEETANYRDETVQSIFWTNCLLYALPEHELQICLVMTNFKLFLFKLIDYLNSSKNIEEIFLPMFCVSLDEISCVVRGIFDLTLRLECSARGFHGTFTFLVCDPDVTDMFMQSLQSSLPLSSGRMLDMLSCDVLNLNEYLLEKMKREIAMSCEKKFEEDEHVLVYAIVKELTIKNAKSTPRTGVFTSSENEDTRSMMNSYSDVLFSSVTRSLVLTNYNIFLCEEDHLHWPLPSYIRDAPSTPQWAVTKHDDVKHIVGIEIYDVTGDPAFVGSCGMTLIIDANRQEYLHREPCKEESSLRVGENRELKLIFKLFEERAQFQRSLSQMWSSKFHGKLQVTESSPLSSLKISQTLRSDVTEPIFQEGFAACSSEDSHNSNKKCHRQNGCRQSNSTLSKDAVYQSIHELRNARTAVLENYFSETLRKISGNDMSEILVYSVWTDCIAYMHPEREIHVWLILSCSKIYVVADGEEKTFLSSAYDALYGIGGKLCAHWLPFVAIRQVCVGLFDQTFRVETDDPANTYTFITRDYHVTSSFIENLKKALNAMAVEPNSKPKTVDSIPSIYDNYQSSEIGSEQLESFHHSNGVIQFVYPNDDTVEILKHSILEYDCQTKIFKCLNDISILLYLLMFQVIERKKSSRTFIVLNDALCTCIENHVNFPLPLFVKGLPAGSRYDMQLLRRITDVRRIEFSGFCSLDFTVVFSDGHEDGKLLSSITQLKDRWHMIAQTYEEREKALGIIARVWKENFGKDLPVVKV